MYRTIYTAQLSRINLFLFFSCLFLTGIYLTLLILYYSDGLLFFCFSLLIILVLLKPEYPYLLIIFSLPIHFLFFQLGNDIYKHYLFHEIFILCTLCSFILSRLGKRRPPYPGTSCDWFLSFFIGWAILSLFWSTNLFQGYFEISKLFLCITTFILTVSLINDHKMLKLILGVFIFMGILQAILCVISLYTHFGVKEEFIVYGQIRFCNFFWADHLIPIQKIRDLSGRGLGMGVPHTSALYLNVAIFFSIGFFLVTKSIYKRTLWLLAIVLLITGMLTTLTKSTLICFWIGLALLLIHLKPLKKWLFTCMFLMLALSVLLFIPARLMDISDSLKYTKKQVDQDTAGTSLGGRIDLWKKGIKKLIETNGLGYGAGGFLRINDDPVPDGTHPAVLFDFGILGLFLWILIYLIPFCTFYDRLKTCKSEYYRRLLLTYLCGYIMMMILWIVTLHYDYVDLFLYLGIGYALVRLSHSDVSDKGNMPFCANAIGLVV